MDAMTEIRLLVENSIASELHEKDFAEVAMRRADAKFKSMVKCRIIGDTTETESLKYKVGNNLIHMNAPSIESVRNSMNKIDTNTHQINNTIKTLSANMEGIFSSLSSIKFLSFVNTGLSLANLAVDIRGFSKVTKEIENVNKKLSGIDEKLNNLLTLHGINLQEEFRNYRGDVITLSNKLRNKKKVNIDTFEEKIRKIGSFIVKLTSLDNENIYESEEFLLEMIYSLVPAYTFLLNEYIKKYYYEEKEFPEEYDFFMEVYDSVLKLYQDTDFLDYLILDKGMHIIDAIDAVNAQKMFILNNITQIEDYSTIIKAFKTEKQLTDFEHGLEKIMIDDIQEKIPEIAENCSIDQNDCKKIIDLLG